MERAIEAGKAILKFDIRKKNLITGIGKIESRLRRSSSSINALGKQLRGVGSGATAIGKKLAGIGAAAAVPIGLATAKFASFDDAIRTAGARMGASKRQIQQLSAASRLLGRQTSFTAASMAELSGVLGQAGFSPRQVLRMQDGVQRLARATGVELSESASVTAATLRQFNLEASDAGRVADVLTSAVNGSFLSLESLGESLSYAGAVAKSAGASLEETTALIGQLGNNAVQGSSAGTALRRLFATIQADGAKIKRIFDVDTVGLGLTDAMDRIGKSIAGLSREQQAAKLNEAFGLLGITSATILSQSADEVRRLEDRFKNARGEAERTAKGIDAGLGGSFRRAASAAEGLALAIGKAISVPAIKLFERLGSAINNLTDELEANPQAIRTIAGGILSVATAGVGMIGLGSVITAIGGAFSVAAIGVTAMASAAGLAVTTLGALPAVAIGIGSITAAATIAGASIIALKDDVISAAKAVGSRLSGSADRVKIAFGQGGLGSTVKQFRKEAVYQISIVSESLKSSLLQAAYVVASGFSAMFRTIAAGVEGLARLLDRIDPTGTAAGVADVAAGVGVSASFAPDQLQKLINKSSKRLATLLANPPSANVPINEARWFRDLKIGAMNIADLIVGSFAEGARKISQATDQAYSQASKGNGRSGGSIGSTAGLFAINNANFGSGQSIDQEQLDVQGDMLEELRSINRNTAAKDAKEVTASDVGKSISKAIGKAGNSIAGGLSPLGKGLSGAVSLIGGLVSPEAPKPYSGPSRATMPRPSVAMPKPSSRSDTPTPATGHHVTPTTGTPFSGFANIERHVRRFGVMVDAAAAAVSWSPRPQPTIQPAPSDEPRWANAFSDFDRGLSRSINGAVTGIRDRLIDGFRAKGGPVKKGGSYIVGEAGPEIFEPDTNGKIIPNLGATNFRPSTPVKPMGNPMGILDKPFTKPLRKMGTAGRLETQLQKKREYEARKAAQLKRGEAVKQARADRIAQAKAAAAEVRAARLAKGQEIKDLRAQIHGAGSAVRQQTMRQAAVTVAGPQLTGIGARAGANANGAMRARVAEDPWSKSDIDSIKQSLTRIAINTEAAFY